MGIQRSVKVCECINCICTCCSQHTFSTTLIKTHLMEATYTKWWMELSVYNTCFIKPTFHSSSSGNSYLKLSSEGELLACVWFHIEVTQIEEWRWLQRDYISLACCVILTPESQIEFSVHVEVIKESPVWFVLYLPVRTILGVQLYNVQCIMYLVHEIFKLFLTLLKQLSLFFMNVATC